MPPNSVIICSVSVEEPTASAQTMQNRDIAVRKAVTSRLLHALVIFLSSCHLPTKKTWNYLTSCPLSEPYAFHGMGHMSQLLPRYLQRQQPPKAKRAKMDESNARPMKPADEMTSTASLHQQTALPNSHFGPKFRGMKLLGEIMSTCHQRMATNCYAAMVFVNLSWDANPRIAFSFPHTSCMNNLCLWFLLGPKKKLPLNLQKNQNPVCPPHPLVECFHRNQHPHA